MRCYTNSLDAASKFAMTGEKSHRIPAALLNGAPAIEEPDASQEEVNEVEEEDSECMGCDNLECSCSSRLEDGIHRVVSDDGIQAVSWVVSDDERM